MSIKTLLVDLGNVLVFFSHDRMLRQIGELCGRSGEEMRQLLFDSQLQWEFERGRISEHDFRQQLSALVDHDIPLAELRRAGSDIFDLNAGMLPLLDAARAQGLRLVLLSNTSVSHIEWVREQFDVLDRFHDLVLSYEAGAIKPEPRIYEVALRKIECAPEECFYTDDIPAYIEKAREFGLQAEVFTNVTNYREALRSRRVHL